ncbi:unnamed protein product [Echinostoma caproni]|uniref:GLOBIN domain-containing protein n=1 Tax=Echinostoma caproni TaxID=27848 RepID=A0A183BAB1_9TREM|nr:unnamed protein product [Echinostoma caproni]
MDQGVLWSFKCSFRKHSLEYVLSLFQDAQPSMKSEVGMHLVKKAWVCLHPYVLINAFIQVGFKPTLTQPMMQSAEDK